MNSKICGVITSINNPTPAIEKFADMDGLTLVVVGDKKTPRDWNYNGVTYLSVEKQMDVSPKLAEGLPWNHYARKMIGYIWAIKNTQCDIVYDTDDDNIPKKNWMVPNFADHYNYVNAKDYVNIYQHFSDKHIWPRGFPLSLIRNEYYSVFNNMTTHNLEVGIWQSLADGDPDVDAIYRLVSNEACIFNENEPVVLGEGSICPFNSQNTFFSREAFPLLYIPSTVTFRFCDILRGLIAQPILWTLGLHLGFTKATVFQERNAHNYFHDFISEVPMYLNVEQVISSVVKRVSARFSCAENLAMSYEALLDLKIVEKSELELVEKWLESLK